MIDWILDRDHPFSTYEAFSEKLTFLTPWYAYLCIRVYEIVVFWETFVTLDKRRQEKITFDHYHFQGSFRMTHRIYDSNMNNGWQNFLRYLSALKKVDRERRWKKASIMHQYANACWNCHCLLGKMQMIYSENRNILRKFECQNFTCCLFCCFSLDFLLYCIRFFVSYSLFQKSHHTNWAQTTAIFDEEKMNPGSLGTKKLC